MNYPMRFRETYQTNTFEELDGLFAKGWYLFSVHTQRSFNRKGEFSDEITYSLGLPIDKEEKGMHHVD